MSVNIINNYYVWVGINQEGHEAILGSKDTESGAIELFAFPTLATANKAEPLVQTIADKTGMNVQLLKFESRRVLKSIIKQGASHDKA